MKWKVFIIMVIVFLLIGCQDTDLTSTTFSYGPIDIEVLNVTATYQRTIIIYHDNNQVVEMHIIDETNFAPGNDQVLNQYEELDKITYSGEIFRVEGFNHHSHSEDDTLVSTSILEFNKMDISKLIETDDWLIDMSQIVDEKQVVNLAKLKKFIQDIGYYLVD